MKFRSAACFGLKDRNGFIHHSSMKRVHGDAAAVGMGDIGCEKMQPTTLFSEHDFARGGLRMFDRAPGGNYVRASLSQSLCDCESDAGSATNRQRGLFLRSRILLANRVIPAEFVLRGSVRRVRWLV